MKKLLLLLPSIIGCLQVSGIDATPHGAQVMLIPEETVTYKGFYIEPMPGTNWRMIPGKQRQDGTGAFWAIVDSQNIRHTTIAIVGISPVLPPKHLKTLSLKVLRKHIKEKIFSENRDRMKDIKVSSKYTTVNGVKFAEVSGSALDTASRHSAVPMRIYIKILSALTPDGRVFSISLSERFPGPDGKPDESAFDRFVRSVHLGQPGQ